jgi:hypothetical protein
MLNPMGSALDRRAVENVALNPLVNHNVELQEAITHVVRNLLHNTEQQIPTAASEKLANFGYFRCETMF